MAGWESRAKSVISTKVWIRHFCHIVWIKKYGRVSKKSFAPKFSCSTGHCLRKVFIETQLAISAIACCEEVVSLKAASHESIVA